MRVLVIEDEHKIANALRRALQQEKYAVDVCYDGDDGYAMATTEPYDVMIIDRMLPGQYDGLAIVRELRSLNIHTPVLLLTALGTVRDKTTGLDTGADDYLVKPFALEELLARVRALIRRPQDQLPNTLTAGDLSIDTTTFEVRRGSVVISLTQKEYALLEYLMRNQNRPLTKEMIISKLWSTSQEYSEGSIRVYINQLKKLFDKDTILNIKGVGYKIEF